MSRPGTARSEISSAISEDAQSSRPQSAAVDLNSPAIPNASRNQHGYAHFRGVVSPTNRSYRSPGTPTSMTASSRPQSPESTTSRTHVPSLTAQGFLRPMSSSRLQQQRLSNLRAARQVNTPPPPPLKDGMSELDEQEEDPHNVRSVPSVATAYTQSEGPDHHDTYSEHFQSDADQEFFRQPEPQEKKMQPPPLNLSKNFKASQPLTSPRSFRSAFSIGKTSPRFEHEKQHLSYAKKSALGRNYEYFEGNNVFWLGGRLQNARDRPINIATAILLILPSILFFIFSAPWLWRHVSPAIPIVYAYIFYLCLSSFLHASLTDPGIYPRNIHPFPQPETDDPLAVGPPTNDWVMVRLATSQTAAMDVPVKYCKTCDIWRPPRCYHCRVCDNCVETLDHHCVWLNNCVGRRNYKYFFAFVSSGTILSLLLTFASLGQVIAYRDQHDVSFAASISQNRIPFAMFIYGILAFGYPSSLWIYHLMLTGRGETTREYLASRRFPKNERHRPFTLGNVFKNWLAVLVRPRPPTYMHFKKQYEEGDQRLSKTRGRKTPPADAAKNESGVEMKPVTPGQNTFEGPHGRIDKPPPQQPEA